MRRRVETSTPAAPGSVAGGSTGAVRPPALERARGVGPGVAVLGRGVLDERDQPAGHEAARAHGRARTGQLGHLHDAARSGHLEPAPGLCGEDLELLDALPGVHEDLDPVALHDGHCRAAVNLPCRATSLRSGRDATPHATRRGRCTLPAPWTSDSRSSPTTRSSARWP